MKSPAKDSGLGSGKVHDGFRTSWEGVQESVKKLMDGLIDETDNKDDYNILCTCHSLGAAIANECNAAFAHDGKYKGRVRVINFASPRVGDKE